MLTRKGSSAGPELHSGHDDTALAHGLVDMSSRFGYWLNFVGWVWSDSAPSVGDNLGRTGFSAAMCTKVAANGSSFLVFFSSGFPVKLVFSHFFVSLTLDTSD